MRHRKTVSVANLILVACVKYLIDFFDLPKSQLHIVTLDKSFRSGIKTISELPNAYDPTANADLLDVVFK
jgi:hypothetical protein